MSMCDRDKRRFKAFEGSYKKQSWKFWERRLSNEGAGARRRTWSSGLTVGGTRIGCTLHGHVGSFTRGFFGAERAGGWWETSYESEGEGEGVVGGE